MAGSIRERPDRGANAFELRIFLGRDASGRVRHRSVLFRGTRRQAERELARLVTEQEAAPAVVPDDDSPAWGPQTTFNDAIAGWKLNGWDDLSPTTARRYDNVWSVHIRDSIGRRRIASTGPYDLERYFRELKAAGAGRETVRYVRALLRRACTLARKWSRNTLPNPVADTEMPSFAADASPAVRAPSAEEVRAVLRAADRVLDMRYGACLRVVAATGARRGEVAALRWSDVDWERSTVRLDEAVVAAQGGAQLKTPKTRSSRRRVAVDAATLGILRALQAEQQRLASLCELTIGDDSFVFSAEPGGTLPPFPDTISRAFLKARNAAGVAADVHLHSLRHFQATAIDVVVPERQTGRTSDGAGDGWSRSRSTLSDRGPPPVTSPRARR